MNIVVIGYGFVGKAMASVLKDNHKVSIVDPRHGTLYEGVGDIKKMVDPEFNIDGFIICVPTPQADNGRCDDSLVADYVYEIVKHHPHSHILIKSTTSVSTLRDFHDFHRVTFSPEFLRGSISADPTKEFRECDFSIYGGGGGRWWHEIFSQLLPIKEVRFLDLESAGFLKYAENSFLATKVMFFNELRHLYDRTIDVNYDGMVEALALDKRIGLSHTKVPGPDGEFGFGGHCLPKDTSEFTEFAQESESPLHILELVRELNKKYRDE